MATVAASASVSPLATVTQAPKVISVGDACSGIGKVCGAVNNTILWCGDASGSANALPTASASTTVAASAATGKCGAAAGPFAACSSGVTVCYPGMTCVSGKCQPPISSLGGVCNAQWQFKFNVCAANAICLTTNPMKETNICVVKPSTTLPTTLGGNACIDDPTADKKCAGSPFCFGGAPSTNNTLSENNWFCQLPGSSSLNINKTVDISVIVASNEAASVDGAPAATSTRAATTTKSAGFKSGIVVLVGLVGLVLAL
ncbi:UNVERIFIED_CONTAM: hypothetical protein HDU68_000938 [Siphonaria sp. JEL0065]|nr:hypothetical protein HDU68_000938 [Siphonaria sp. JEL0065]